MARKKKSDTETKKAPSANKAGNGQNNVVELAKSRKRRAAQLEIAGAERPRDEELDELIETVLEHTEARDTHEEKRKETQQALREAMGEKGIDTYKWYDGEQPYTAKRKNRTDVVSITKDKLKRNKEAAA